MPSPVMVFHLAQRFHRHTQRLLSSALLISGGLTSSLLWTPSALAQTSPTAGVIIRNVAEGNFVDADLPGPPVSVESNEVIVTVAEITGITITPKQVIEAPVGTAGGGIYQGRRGINTDDIVYFDYTITNVGNDPTQFFIPTNAGAIVGGTQAGPIQIIEVDPDGPGAGAGIAKAVTVTTGGQTGPDGAGNPGLLGNEGIIPIGGTVTVRIPVRVTALNPTDPISATLGNVPGTTKQNQPYVNNGNDLYTVDNTDGQMGNPGSADDELVNGPPDNGDTTGHRQEAEAPLATVLDPSVPGPGCTTPLAAGSFPSATSGNALYSIDPTTGVASPALAELPVKPAALGREARDGNVYFTSEASSNAPLYLWNAETGAVSNTGVSFPNSGVIQRMAFNNNFQGYAISATGELYRFTTDATPVITPLGTLTTTTGNPITDFVNGDIAFDSNGQLWMVAGVTLFKVDLSTATPRAIPIGAFTNSGGTLLTGSLTGLAFDRSGTVYLTDANNIFYTANLATLVATQRGGMSGGNQVGDLGTCAFAPFAANLSSTKMVNPTGQIDAAIAGPITYTITITNSGTAPATTVNLTELIPMGTKYVPNSTQMNGVAVADNGTTMPFTAGRSVNSPTGPNISPGAVIVGPGKSVVVTFQVRVNKYGVSQISNQATVTYDGSPPLLSDDPTQPGTADPTVNSVISLPSDPGLVLVKRITAINGVPFTQTIDDTYDNPATPENEALVDNDPKWPNPDPGTNFSQFLRGRIDGGTVKPGDEMEYTIYFLSNGNTPVTNVKLCDLVPSNSTFLPSGFNGRIPADGGIPNANAGIELNINGTSTFLSNVEDTPDRGIFYEIGTTPNANCAAVNTNGAVVVQVVNSGFTPPNNELSAGAYGYIRFKATVK